MLSDSKKTGRPTRELDRLEADIKALKIEFDKFFNGAQAAPPEAVRSRLAKRFRLLRSRHLRNLADRFRLNSLETRFNVLSELWLRRLRESEQAARQTPTSAASPSRRALDPFTGILLGGTHDRSGVELLYNELYRSTGRSSKIDFDTFQRYLDQHIGRLRARTGCSEVQFRIADDKGELKLKAKPLRIEPIEEE